MFRNYLKIAIRNLIRQKLYSVINILGLSIGIACFLLISLWVYNELSYPPDSLTTNNLIFQHIFWPSIVHMVQTADSSNIKLTLALQSQMAAYIAKNRDSLHSKEGIIQVPEDINLNVAFAKLAAMGIEIDTWTPEQVSYNNDFQEGT